MSDESPSPDGSWNVKLLLKPQILGKDDCPWFYTVFNPDLVLGSSYSHDKFILYNSCFGPGGNMVDLSKCKPGSGLI